MKKFKNKTAKEWVDSADIGVILDQVEAISDNHILRENDFGGIYICDKNSLILAKLPADAETMEKLYCLMDAIFMAKLESM